MNLSVTAIVRSKMEQITPTGVSGDYYNALLVPLIQYRDFREGVDGAVREIINTPIKRYTERYPLDRYEDVITSYNSAAVCRLDGIADELNSRAREGTLTDLDYRSLHLEAVRLIYGSEVKESFGGGKTD